jgi:hypothetical protein
MWLAAYEHWWRETSNPLHVWDAIGRCVGCGEPIPEWCRRYLAETSRNLAELSRRVLDKEMPADKAYKRSPEALGFGRQGKKNAFAALAEDREKGQDALDEYHRKEIGAGDARPVADEVADRRSISQESARRRIRDGQRLLRLPRTSKPL